MQTVACPDCDLLQTVPELPAGGKASCARCGHTLATGTADPIGRPLALSIAALLMLIIANIDPLMGLSAVGRHASTTIIGGAYQMWIEGEQATAVVVGFCAVVAPAGYILFMLIVLLGAGRTPVPGWVGELLRWADGMRPWSMVEVMMLGILVALIKIADLAKVEPGIGSVGVGSPIYFRRLQVGQVMTYKLAADGNSVSIRVFVNAPYDQFVSPQTRFWNASGVDVSLGAGGLDVRTQSLVSLLIGGIAFETPAFATESAPADADTTFTLYGDRTTAMQQPETIARHYVLYFNESLRGLSVGAPVTLLGLPAGEVTDVGIDIDPATSALRGRVEIVAYPERVLSRLHTGQSASAQAIAQSPEQSHAFFQRQVSDRGLRAQLQSGNLLTGQLFVAFDFFPDAAKADVDWSQQTAAIPTVPSTLPNLEAKVSNILAKVDKIPFEAIGDEVKQTLLTLNKAIGEIDKAVGHIDAGVTPELKSAIAEFRRAMVTADRVLKNTDETLLGKDAPGQLELRDALQEVGRAARSFRVLTDYLERNPSSLIRGKEGGRR